MMPDAGDMKSPVLRHRIWVSYVPLRLNQEQMSCAGILANAKHAISISYVVQNA